MTWLDIFHTVGIVIFAAAVAALFVSEVRGAWGRKR